MEKCNCDHSDCDDKKEIRTPESKVEDLIKAIKDLGFKVEKTKDGEIRITE
jgi:hypothetical protein